MVGSFDFSIPPQLDVFGRDPVLAEVGIRSSVTAPCNATYRSIKTGAVKRSGRIRSVVRSSDAGKKARWELGSVLKPLVVDETE
jgi:hypothetical protein